MDQGMSSSGSGVLILSHCGFSFLEDLMAELRRRQLRCFVLSSLPLPEHVPFRSEQIQTWADWLYTTDSHQLKLEDISRALQALCELGEQVACCISVWEGYRHLMASANASLGIYDIDTQQALAIRNKLKVRNQLAECGLSRANAYALTADLLQSLKTHKHRYFIKPIHGVASYAAFSMREDTTWNALKELRQASVEDTVYASAFNDGLEFMVENYIPGHEFSFEILVVDGQIYVVAIHEKYELTETSETVLEVSCTTPPVSLDQTQIATGLHWLKSVFDCLDLKWGCFHVEARFTGHYWDLIEINPRVGGSLISHSVEALTHGHSMLSLWLELLLTSDEDVQRHKDFVQRLAPYVWRADGTSGQSMATFFRVYFARPGTVRSVTLNKLPLAPAVMHILLKEGDVVPSHAREVFLGQLLWTFQRAKQASELEQLVSVCATALDIQYLVENC